MKSTNYQDYVIKNGRFVGRFEEMYSECQEIPWHQDETAIAIFTDLDLSILRHMNARHSFERVADIGCGLGYVTARIKAEVLRAKDAMTGFDVSSSAVMKARRMFPGICFESLDITKPISPDLHGIFDLVICKECHWYVLNHLEQFRSNLLKMSKRWVYLVQSFPEKKPYLGMDKFPTPEAFINYWTEVGHSAYHLIEWDSLYGGRPLVHLFLGKEAQSK
jgi:SAM-dependent methyltransferase